MACLRLNIKFEIGLYIYGLLFLGIYCELQPEYPNGPHILEERYCHLHASEEEKLHIKIKALLDGGSKLIEYNLTFSGDNLNPNPFQGKHGKSYNYRPTEWQRVLSKHGKTLLSLAFNYDVLSLSMLSFGVAHLDVVLVDGPHGCFWNLTEDEQMKEITKIIMNDFRSHVKEERWMKDDHYICHKVIRKQNNNAAEFVHKCCKHTEPHFTYCEDSKPSIWVSMLYGAIQVMDFLFFFFAPGFVVEAFYGASYRVTNYLINLKDAHLTTIKKDSSQCTSKIPVNVHSKNKHKQSKRQQPGKPPTVERTLSVESAYYKKKYTECLGKLPNNTIAKVKMEVLHIQVDHKSLMTEKEVNVGLSAFLWRNIILCKIKDYYPFQHCCYQSIFGAWGQQFFCLYIPRNNSLVHKMQALNAKWGIILSWKKLARSLSVLFFLGLLLIPYYLRVIFFKVFEDKEVTARVKAATALNLHIHSKSSFLVYFTPHHPLHIFFLCMYWISTMFIMIIYRQNKIKFMEYVVSILQDVKHINRLESFRMLALHIIMPFQKFGLCGFIIGPIYWIFAIPICLITITLYCVPTLYLIGRFLVPSKPQYVETHLSKKKNDLEMDPMQEQKYDTIASAMMLTKISPRPDDRLPSQPLGKDGTLTNTKPTDYTTFQKVVIGILLSLWLVSLLALYAECFGFITEVLTLTCMGAIVNAGSAGQYFMLLFFIITYTLSVLNTVHDKYQQLSTNIFQHIKEKLNDELIETVTFLDSNKCYGFKFFNQKEIRELFTRKQLHVYPEDYDTDQCCPIIPPEYKDSFEIRSRKLHWKLHHTILFLDKNDVPRIPRKLFDDIMNIDCPGCPGPLHRSLLEACARLLYMCLFLFFVIVVVMTFGDAYEISTTNQLLLTLAGGFIPFFIGTVLKPKTVVLDLSSYSFKGKIHEIIMNYTDSWPVYDLEFETVSSEPIKHSNKTNVSKPAVDYVDEGMPSETLCLKAGFQPSNQNPRKSNIASSTIDLTELEKQLESELIPLDDDVQANEESKLILEDKNKTEVQETDKGETVPKVIEAKYTDPGGSVRDNMIILPSVAIHLGTAKPKLQETKPVHTAATDNNNRTYAKRELVPKVYQIETNTGTLDADLVLHMNSQSDDGPSSLGYDELCVIS